jgi:hypothetical protein
VNASEEVLAHENNDIPLSRRPLFAGPSPKAALSHESD